MIGVNFSKQLFRKKYHLKLFKPMLIPIKYLLFYIDEEHDFYLYHKIDLLIGLLFYFCKKVSNLGSCTIGKCVDLH